MIVLTVSFLSYYSTLSFTSTTVISIVNLFSEMRYIAAYLLATMGGNASPSADDVKQILGSVGVDVDEEQLQVVIDQLAGKDVNEVMASGECIFLYYNYLRLCSWWQLSNLNHNVVLLHFDLKHIYLANDFTIVLF